MSLATLAGGEWEGVTLTEDEKVGGKVLAMRRASKQLNLSDHFWSSCSIWLSVADLLSTGFLDSEVVGLSFLAFFSVGTAVGGDDMVPVSLTASITETVDG